jgi:hypothetical protein
MNKYNWLIHTNVGDTKPFEKALENYSKDNNVTGNTSAIGPNTKQLELYGMEDYKCLLLNHIKKIRHTNLDLSLFGNVKNYVAWSVEGHEGSYHRLHRHGKVGYDHVRNNINISTVLYLNVPDKDPKGQFYFLLEKKDGVSFNCITPEVGDLFIFPWSVYHGVYPQGPGLRKTINFDFIFDSM